MRYSIIFLVDEESGEFSDFFDLIYEIFERQGEDFEVVVVGNGTESFVSRVLSCKEIRLEKTKVIGFPHRVHQAVCLKAALVEARGSEVLALGPSQELSAPSYEKLIHSMRDGVDLVVPFRKVRKDARINRFHSRMLNKAVGLLLGFELKDIGCNVRHFRRAIMEELFLYGNMYRYFPVLAAQKGFKFLEIECDQSDKARRTRYYSLRLYLDRFVELLNLFFSVNFSRKPLRFFNLIGVTLMGAGVMLLLYVGIQRIFFDVLIGVRPPLIIGIMCLVGGTQVASFGLLGEIISFVHGRFLKEYTIEKII
jgi:hypothetical protein